VEATACTCQGAEFQSPIHRGNHPDRTIHELGEGEDLVSIPYSSGQSSGLDYAAGLGVVIVGFNPLFIGAIIRTRLPISTAPNGKTGFNPLFIGAIIRTRPSPDPKGES